MATEQLFIPLDEIAPSSFLEKYTLNGSDSIVRFAAGKNVVLSVESGDGLGLRERDSNRVHTRVLSDYSEYNWASEDSDSCHGRVLAVHGNLVAYRLFNESTGEAVRVLEREKRNRHLIKGFMHPTADLQWASHRPLLAVLDTNADLYVYHVNENCEVTKYLNVMRDENSVPAGLFPRFSWCPYIPETEEPHEVVHMLAVYYGGTVELITLNGVKAELKTEEVHLDKLSEISDALIKLPKEDITAEVRAVCVSPDTTAIAVAQGITSQDVGTVLFYIVDSEGARFAHRWQPDSPYPIHDLIFLDNIDVNSETPEQFWKYAIAVTDGGKRLDLYESENWHCIGRLRFESADRLSKFSISLDPSARFLFIADYDAGNIHCVELGYVGGVPHFAACTQITFCHPLISVVPYSVTTGVFSGDVSLEDEDANVSRVVASLVALSHRSLLQLEFELDTACSEGHKEGGDTKLLTTVNNVPREEEANGSVFRRPEKETEMLEAMHNQLESLAMQMERAAEEADRQRREDRARTDSLIQQLKDEMVSRDERMLLKFDSLISDSRTATVEAIQTSLELKMDSVTDSLRSPRNKQQSSESVSALSEELGKSVREAMMSVVVPALESLCANLFQQLNETFRLGLDQFMRQLRALHGDAQHTGGVAAASTSSSLPSVGEGPSLIQLIENQCISTAFEKALSRKDLSALMFVCNNVDPETLFSSDQPLPQAILLCILHQLAVKLEGETDLKFRYIENCLMALHVKDPSIAASYRQVLDRLQSSISAFMSQEVNSSYKRQARIILHLILNMLK